MKIVRDIRSAGLSLPGSVVTLGNFDGIHVGHQALLRNAIADARAMTVPAVVFTFEPHPLRFLAPARAPKLLLDIDDKMELFAAAGIDITIVQPFDELFAGLEAAEFIRTFLAQKLRLKKIWAGQDLRFGKARRGTVEALGVWGRELGFAVGTVEPVLIGGERVSSSRIRQLIDDGRIDEVQPLLGRYHFVSGKVVSGQRRGRDIGFPTANIESRTEVLPADGIYATFIEVDGQRWPSASSIGRNPTFGAGPRTVESFIFEFNRDIYGKDVKLSFVKLLRGEEKFSSVAALVSQIERDVAAAKAVLAVSG